VASLTIISATPRTPAVFPVTAADRVPVLVAVGLVRRHGRFVGSASLWSDDRMVAYMAL
jgi:hypothetical protein